MGEDGFEVEEVAVGPTGSRVRVAGHLTYHGVERLRRELARVVRVPSATRIDLSGVESLDGGAAAVLAEAWSDALRGGAAVHFEGAPASVKSILDLYTERVARECLRPPPGRLSIPEHVGRATVDLGRRVREVLEFAGKCFTSAIAAIRDPRSIHWRDFPRMIERHGADGLPIVLTIGTLIGVITSYQASLQLKQFGADPFVADLLSLGLTRELSPLMTAIVVAGRSGAAIAAALGTMAVSEEIDALKTLRLDPIRFLVFPRVLAVILVVPILTLLADIVGIVGGMLVAISLLEISLEGFALRVQDALSFWDVFGGLIKGAVFGAIICLQAAERGFAARGGAEGVGRSTTSAVVATLFLLVVTDALFSVLYNQFGI